MGMWAACAMTLPRASNNATEQSEARCEVPEVDAPTDHVVEARIRDAAAEVVAVVRATWRLAPVPGSQPLPTPGGESR